MESALATDSDGSVLQQRLEQALKRRFGAGVHCAELDIPTLGGSNRTVLFDLVDGTTRRRLVLRQETYRLENSPFISPRRQFELLRVAAGAGIPVPEPLFELEPEDRLDRGYVMGYVAGETMPKKILSEPRYERARAAFARQCGEILARLHAVEPALGAVVADTADSRDPLAAQAARYDWYGEIHPALDLALRWLERRRPLRSNPVLVHGDFRLGNLIINPDGVAAVLDWECAHMGDRHADFGWLCLRSWRFGRIDRPVAGISEREALYRAYEDAGGAPVDPEAVHWWEVFGFVRWVVLNIMQAHGHVSGARRGLPFAACGRNACLIEYDLMMTLAGRYS